MRVNAAADPEGASILRIPETVITVRFPAADSSARFMRFHFQRRQEKEPAQNVENEIKKM